ncbi:MAG: GtrA family protein [Lachnospiraceae bacterium]|nr:GtrA family protein [Lachnospiraceae bacterium]
MNKELIRTIKFTLFSISAGIVEAGVFALLKMVTNFKYWPCYLIALICSVLWNFTLNREITFKSSGNVPLAMAKVVAFYLVFTPVSTWVGDYLVERAGWNEILVLGITMLSNFVLEYLYDRFFVFGSTLDTKKSRKR